MHLAPDEGVNVLRQRHPTYEFACENNEILIDIDTPEDYESRGWRNLNLKRRITDKCQNAISNLLGKLTFCANCRFNRYICFNRAGNSLRLALLARLPVYIS